MHFLAACLDLFFFADFSAFRFEKLFVHFQEEEEEEADEEEEEEAEKTFACLAWHFT